MDLTEAYKAVYNDLMNCPNPILRGEVDDKYKDKIYNFLVGVDYVMEIIAAKANTLSEYHALNT